MVSHGGWTVGPNESNSGTQLGCSALDSLQMGNDDERARSIERGPQPKRCGFREPSSPLILAVVRFAFGARGGRGNRKSAQRRPFSRQRLEKRLRLVDVSPRLTSQQASRFGRLIRSRAESSPGYKSKLQKRERGSRRYKHRHVRCSAEGSSLVITWWAVR